MVRGGGVKDRVERRVVVHLELAVELEAAATGADVCPERVETGGEIVALFMQDSETFAVPGAMPG
jgi:hypothetical protein